MDDYGVKDVKKRVFLLTYERVGSIAQALRKVHMCRHTLDAWVAGSTAGEHPAAYGEDFVGAMEAAVEHRNYMLEAEARRRAFKGSDTMLIFLLKAARPHVYRENFRVEHSGPDGKPLTTNQHVAVQVNALMQGIQSPEQLEKVVEMAKKMGLLDRVIGPPLLEAVPRENNMVEIRQVRVVEHEQSRLGSETP